MSLLAIRRRVNYWIQRPIGRLVGLLVLTAMFLGGMQPEKIHAHTDGDRDHDHSAHWMTDAPSDEDHHGSSPDLASDRGAAEGVFHAHEVVTTASALPSLPVLVLDTVAPVVPVIRIESSPPPSAARIPPQRPPIA